MWLQIIAFLVLAYLFNSIRCYIALRRKYAHIPGCAQFLPLLPFKIPYLQVYDVNNLGAEVANLIDELGGEKRIAKLILGSKCLVFVWYVYCY